MAKKPTVFHITHYKAGSQWVSAVLRGCAPRRWVLPRPAVAHFTDDPIKPGLIYPAVYLPRPTFEEVLHRNGYSAQQQRDSIRKVVVMRDLRDTLVSLYFSIKVSHEMLNDQQALLREKLWMLETEDGLMLLLRNVLRKYQPMQLSWLDDADALHIRYEELIADEQAAFEQILDHCHINVFGWRRRWVVRKHSFQVVTGRAPGTEDVTAHHRKGITGDWQKYFTDRVKEEFKKIHGHVLIQTGYESDLNW